MNKKFFHISIFFAVISIVMFVAGVILGFTFQFFNFIKIITIFQYSTFLVFAFFITSLQERLRTSPRKEIYLILGFLVAMLSFYEVLFNFFYWFSLYNFYGLGTDLDLVKNLISEHRTSIFNITGAMNLTEAEILNKAGLYPINLNFASKISVLIFFCSIYWIYLIHKLMKEEKS